MKTDGRCSSCKLCRYLLADPEEAPFMGFYCVNEESAHFGKVMSRNGGDGTGCDKYERADYKLKEMSLKDALRTLTLPGMEGSYPINRFNYGKEEDGTVFIAWTFKKNRDLLKFRDALTRCVEEYIKLAKEDGDFED